MVVDVEELDKLDAQEIRARRLNAMKKVLMSKRGESFKFLFRRRISEVGRKRPGMPKIHLNSGTPCARGAQRCSSRSRRMTLKPEMISGIFR